MTDIIGSLIFKFDDGIENRIIDQRERLLDTAYKAALKSKLVIFQVNVKWNGIVSNMSTTLDIIGRDRTVYDIPFER